MTQYVRITAGKDKGKIYPVIDNCEEYFKLDIEIPQYRYFEKEECELIQMPEKQENTDDTHVLAAMFACTFSDNASPFGVAFDAYLSGFLSGFKAGKSEPKVLEEGQHLISTEQLKEIEALGCIMLEPSTLRGLLKEWFPLVFAPEKTYKNGDLIQIDVEIDPHKVVVVHVGKPMFFLLRNDGKVWHHLREMKHSDTISGAEMKEYIGNYSFTLLPETTDQMV